MSTEDLERFTRCARMFEDRVALVAEGQWGDPTPCTEWDVRALVNHVAVELLWVPPLVDGRTIADVGDSLDGDQLGPDPKATTVRAAEAAQASFAADGALDGVVHLSYGDDQTVSYCHQLTLDLLIHGWDLASGIDDSTVLPDDLVEWAYGYTKPMEPMLRASGLYGTEQEVPADAPTQTRLLALLGRQG